jgi:hypothetical protein
MMKVDVAREELLNKISDLETSRSLLISEHERERADFNKVIKEIKSKADAEIIEVCICTSTIHASNYS